MYSLGFVGFEFLRNYCIGLIVVVVAVTAGTSTSTIPGIYLNTNVWFICICEVLELIVFCFCRYFGFGGLGFHRSFRKTAGSINN